MARLLSQRPDGRGEAYRSLRLDSSRAAGFGLPLSGFTVFFLPFRAAPSMKAVGRVASIAYFTFVLRGVGSFGGTTPTSRVVNGLAHSHFIQVVLELFAAV